jgi:hypothetical protein
VPDEIDGPGVDGDETIGCGGDSIGGGVTETDRCMVAMWMAGRARQKDEVPLPEGCETTGSILRGRAEVEGVASGACSKVALSRGRRRSRLRSRSRLSRFFVLLVSSSFSTSL